MQKHIKKTRGDAKPTKEERAAAIAELQRLLPNGSLVYVVYHYRTRTEARIAFYAIDRQTTGDSNPMRSIQEEIHTLLGYRYSGKYPCLLITGDVMAAASPAAQIVHKIGELIGLDGSMRQIGYTAL